MILDEKHWNAQAKKEKGLGRVLNRSWPEADKWSFHHEQLKILKTLYDFKDKSVLDLGCGIGRMSVEFLKLGSKVTCLDISEEMLKICKKETENKCTYVNKDVISEELDIYTYDVIFCSSLFIHILDDSDLVDLYSKLSKICKNLIVCNELGEKTETLKEYCRVRTKHDYDIYAKRFFLIKRSGLFTFNNVKHYIQHLEVK